MVDDTTEGVKDSLPRMENIVVAIVHGSPVSAGKQTVSKLAGKLHAMEVKAELKEEDCIFHDCVEVLRKYSKPH